MNNEPVTGALARRFLLGDVADDDRERIEALFLSDQETKNSILVAEEDLIEEYLENSLTAGERERFLKRYGQTPQQKRKLRIVRSIKEYAAGDAAFILRRPAISKWRAVLAALGPGNLKVFIPVAATLTVALVLAAFFLLDLNNRTQRNNRRLAIERELAELNAPSNPPTNPTQMAAIVLTPLLVRSPQSQPEVTLHSDLRVIELQLLWIQRELYSSYRALVKRGGAEEFAIANLRLEKKNGGNMVRVRLPLQILSRGSYQVSLSGIAANGTPESAEEYSFTVSE